jgi:hypothetical protein
MAHEYAVRFLVGGLITAAAGIIAKKFGPTVGGLFLAFPAIFPAGATLIEKHEKQRKENEGLQGTERGREAARVAGSAIGSLGLFAFADFSFPNWTSGCAIEYTRSSIADTQACKRSDKNGYLVSQLAVARCLDRIAGLRGCYLIRMVHGRANPQPQ